MLKTLGQSLIVLNLFAKKENWTAKELAEQTDMPQINVYRILETFVNHQYLTKNEETKQYKIGPQLALLGNTAYQSLNVHELISPYLLRLMEKTGEAVFLVKKEGIMGTNIDSLTPENKVSFAVSLNQSYPLYAGASYWSILAYLTDAEQKKVLEGSFKELRNPEKLTDTLLKQALIEVKSNGWVASSELLTPDVVAIASPIFSNNVIVGSITVATPVYRTTEKDIQSLGQLVKDSAEQISRVLSDYQLTLDAYHS